ncbi:MAG: excinuclease ABC subunit UvrC [Elusimicrobia bacterium]|nr:excinuclease ABC subunit UvrC [Elusimicrobiota bacterium]
MTDTEMRLSHLPHACGVYIMRDAGMQVIYVGKAIDLAKRVSQYFVPARQDRKTALLAPLVRKIDYVACASERDSLLLERKLIRRLRPVFNTMWRDDKSYPYLKITLGEDFPRIGMTRQRVRDGGVYFGPYPKVSMVKGLLKRLWNKRLFPMRPCTWTFSVERPLAERKIKACLYYHTKQCPAPCAGPAAGRISKDDYRRIAENAVLFFKGRYKELAREWAAEMKEASASMEFERAAQLRDNLQAVEHMAERVRLEEVTAAGLAVRLESSRGVTELQAALSLAKPPHHIEAFDISHFQGKQTVASMVCFKGGTASKDDYRRFRIKTVSGVDDFLSMKEVVSRRYARLAREGAAALPDLVLIDGGKGQLAMAELAMAELKLRVPLASIAKRLEEVFLPGRQDSILLPADSPALHLLQRVRDEAHRFAVAYHTLLRKKDLLDRAPT